MVAIKITDKKNKSKFNKLAQHPLQSWEWGEFRKKTGVKVARWGIYDKEKLVEPIQVTIHSLPLLPWSVGYLPKGYFPSKNHVRTLEKIAREHSCIFIKIEPMVKKDDVSKGKYKFLRDNGFVNGRPLFTKYNFLLDLDKSEDELMKQMKSKTRYNIRLAERKGVKVSIDNSDETFDKYLKLTKATTKRQGFYAHSSSYHRKMWEILHKAGLATLIKAEYQGKILVTWILFKFNNTLYYPYGASSSEHRNLMASNLVMWEAIRYAKGEGLEYFDMWGALGSDPDKKHAWYGFHKFKEGYGARHVEYVGTYDYVVRPIVYWLFRAINAVRWGILRLLKQFILRVRL